MVSLVTRPNMEAQRQHAPKSSPWKPWRGVHALCLLATLLVALAAAPDSDSFRFVVLGDRTGGAQPGIYEQVWQVAAAEGPAFVVTVGDTIEGLNDATVETEWEAVEHILAPNRRYALYLAPGNHDVWSEKSERAFRKHARHSPHYGFDYEQAHFTVLDNSRSDQFSSDELRFLEQDLQAHAAQPVKFIVSHRPSWLMDVMFANPNFALDRLAKKYGVQYVIAGHIHEMLQMHLDGVTYLSMASAGGHLRASKDYADGWFFGYGLVEVNGRDVKFQIKELKPPYGLGRVTRPEDWGRAGLVERRESPVEK
jgi:UDP-2,3-diacylglucosamine pyrophosphatase LpxH